MPVAIAIAVALLATAPGLRAPARAGEMEQRMSARRFRAGWTR
jgi:hypothetical protein